MIFRISAVLQVLLCTLVVFVSLGNAIEPLPISRLVPVAASSIPVAPKFDHIAPKVIIPSKRGSGSGSKSGGSGGGRNSKGGSRSGKKSLPKLKQLPREEEEITAEDDASVFALRSYEDEEGDEQRLFESTIFALCMKASTETCRLRRTESCLLLQDVRLLRSERGLSSDRGPKSICGSHRHAARSIP